MEACEEIPYALYISGYDHLRGIPEFAAGDFYIQDFSSMMVAHSAGIRANDHIIDVCAAPGGKSLHAAELLAGTGLVEARDVSDYKVSLLQENIARMGRMSLYVMPHAPDLVLLPENQTSNTIWMRKSKKILQSCSGISWMWYALM